MAMDMIRPNGSADVDREQMPHGGPAAVTVVAGYTAWFCLLFSPALVAGRLLGYEDALHLNLPYFSADHTTWTPYLQGGYPGGADPQFALWYPPARLLCLVPGGWNLFILIAYVLASSCSYGYVWRLTGSQVAALVGGLVYGTCGFLISHFRHPGLLHAAAWFPLVVWSIEEVCRRPGLWWAAVLGIGTAHCILAGHPQPAAYLAPMAAAYLAVRVPWRVGPAVRCVTLTAVGGALGVGLAAVQLLPTARHFELTARATSAPDLVHAFALPSWQLPSLIFPYAFGGLDVPGSEAAEPYFGVPNLGELTGYVGILPLAFAGIGVWAGRGRALTWFWLGWGLWAVLLALGPLTPAGRVAAHLPCYNHFRCPGRHFAEFGLAVSVLAGLGISSSQGLRFKDALPRLVGATVGILVAVAAAWTCLVLEERAGLFGPAAAGVGAHFSASPQDRLAIAVPLLLTPASLGALWLWHARRGRLTTAVLLACLAADLAAFVSGWEWRRASQTRLDDLRRDPPALHECLTHLRSTDERLYAPSVEPLLETAPSNIALLWRVRNVCVDSPLRMVRHADLFSADPLLAGPLADVFGIRYALIPRSPCVRQGITWRRESALNCFSLEDLPTGGKARVEVSVGPFTADALAMVSYAAGCEDLPTGTAVAEVVVSTAEGAEFRVPVRVGDHTSELCAGRPEVLARLRHRHAPAFYEGGDAAPKDDATPPPWRLGELPFPAPARVVRLSLRWTGPANGAVVVSRLSLADRRAGRFLPVETLCTDRTRWREVAEVPGATLYENLHPLPKCWLVDDVRLLDGPRILDCFRSGTLPGGEPFRPYRTALVEWPYEPPVRGAAAELRGVAEIRSSADEEMVIRTSTDRPAFLVVGEINSPGWKGYVDGDRVDIVQTDYLFRGVPVPAGVHDVRFVFRPRGFELGAGMSSFSALVLLGLLVWGRRPVRP